MRGSDTSSVGITLDLYSLVSPNPRDEVAQKLDVALRKELDKQRKTVN